MTPKEQYKLAYRYARIIRKNHGAHIASEYSKLCLEQNISNSMKILALVSQTAKLFQVFTGNDLLKSGLVLARYTKR